MSSGSIEDRIILLEQKVRQLESNSRLDTTPQPWWDRIAGAFKEDPVYAAASVTSKVQCPPVHQCISNH